MGTKKRQTRVSLRLQGGGSSGAFTWGALDRLLNDLSIEIVDIHGTSAGALNGAAVTAGIEQYGQTPEGRKQAQENLDQLWESMFVDYASQQHKAGAEALNTILSACLPFYQASQSRVLFRVFQFNLKQNFPDISLLQTGQHIRLTVNAMNDQGEEILFTGKNLTHSALQASAAIPPTLQPVIINGVKHFDGAFSANPHMDDLHTMSEAKIDKIIFVMTSPPEHPINFKRQANLADHDRHDPSNIIYHEAYHEIADLLRQKESGTRIPDILIVWPPIDKAWSAKQKMDLTRRAGLARKDMGKKAMEDLIRQCNGSIRNCPSITLAELDQRALRQDRSATSQIKSYTLAAA